MLFVKKNEDKRGNKQQKQKENSGKRDNTSGPFY